MKILLILLITLSFPLVGQKKEFDVIKVRDNVYVLKRILDPGAFVCGNITLVINENDALVVDSGFTPEIANSAIEEIKKLTSKPVKYLVNTHWHGDHWHGNGTFVKAFPDIKIISTQRGQNEIQTRGKQDLLPNGFIEQFTKQVATYEEILSTGMENGQKVTSERLDRIRLILEAKTKQKEIASLKDLIPVTPNFTFTDRMTIQSGTRQIQFHYLGFGNTSGDCVIYLPDDKIIITGDLVVMPSPYESGAFCREWKETLIKLREFQFDILIPGHGDPQPNRDYLDFLIRLFDEIIVQTRTCANTTQMRTLEEVKKTVTHESVVSAIRKSDGAKFEEFLQKLNAQFVSAAVTSAFPKAREGKL